METHGEITRILRQRDNLSKVVIHGWIDIDGVEEQFRAGLFLDVKDVDFKVGDEFTLTGCVYTCNDMHKMSGHSIIVNTKEYIINVEETW